MVLTNGVNILRTKSLLSENFVMRMLQLVYVSHIHFNINLLTFLRNIMIPVLILTANIPFNVK